MKGSSYDYIKVKHILQVPIDKHSNLYQTIIAFYKNFTINDIF